MHTEQQIRDWAHLVHVNRSKDGGLYTVLTMLVVATGKVSNRYGWIRVDGATGPVAHGWIQMFGWLAGDTEAARVLRVEMTKRSASPADVAAAHSEALSESDEAICDCDGSHAPTPGGHSVACRRRETLDLYGEPTIDEQHAEALRLNGTIATLNDRRILLGMVSTACGWPETFRAWTVRHGLNLAQCTADDLVAAHEADHAEALTPGARALAQIARLASC